MNFNVQKSPQQVTENNDIYLPAEECKACQSKQSLYTVVSCLLSVTVLLRIVVDIDLIVVVVTARGTECPGVENIICKVGRGNKFTVIFLLPHVQQMKI